MPLKDLPPDAQPREKLLARGPAALADAELLAIVLRTGTAGRGVLQMAQELLAHFGVAVGGHEAGREVADQGADRRRVFVSGGAQAQFGERRCCAAPARRGGLRHGAPERPLDAACRPAAGRIQRGLREGGLRAGRVGLGRGGCEGEGGVLPGTRAGPWLGRGVDNARPDDDAEHEQQRKPAQDVEQPGKECRRPGTLQRVRQAQCRRPGGEQAGGEERDDGREPAGRWRSFHGRIVGGVGRGRQYTPSPRPGRARWCCSA